MERLCYIILIQGLNKRRHPVTVCFCLFFQHCRQSGAHLHILPIFQEREPSNSINPAVDGGYRSMDCRANSSHPTALNSSPFSHIPLRPFQQRNFRNYISKQHFKSDKYLHDCKVFVFICQDQAIASPQRISMRREAHPPNLPHSTFYLNYTSSFCWIASRFWAQNVRSSRSY